MNMSRWDVARVMIRTSSWEPINKVVKVRINGLFSSIRLLEEPFHEIIYSHKKPRKEDDEASSSYSDSMSFSQFLVNSNLGSSIGSDAVENIQLLFGSQEVVVGSINDEARCGVCENEEGQGR